ncbi:hypothetical protein [Rodentibacter haemolyticus]|uniref:SMI1/KNR4 family protein n=1 Tax=Rodentibacter haemolyticus TaxID=2778911 RepID=A0ABX6UUI8_9PAST|nr:hypothetical protein [Rodentibacter haemolyticus]QPB41637.1 hypothetical protein IHV77_06725 [Rodentibacter haemolyticus]
MSYLNKLIKISSKSLYPMYSINEQYIKLKDLFSYKNGFVAFEGCLRILPLVDIENERTIYSWNKFLNFETKEYIFFGDNVLGDGFCTYKNLFYKYDFESGDLEFMGNTLEDFSKELIINYNYYTGYSIAKQWMETQSVVSFNDVLMPKIPFILGGEYSINNLYMSNIYESIQLKQYIYNKTKESEDGEKIKLTLS